MTIARYSFLPWVRRGLANHVAVPAAGARATVPVTVTVAGDADPPRTLAPKQVQLIGPGDVIGISARQVIRTEPRRWATDFEPNYLACVEFYDEDFAWRYSPVPADPVHHRLTPWIALVVLKESECTVDRRPGRELPSLTLAAGVDAAAVFAPPTQLWAWAHVHLNADLGPGHTPNLETLDLRLRGNPDTGYCRLVCPRRLAPDTAYHAFVVPVFEVGRKAGLGEPVAPADTAVAIAWETARELPIYYEWFFRTGPAGDFEELARRLEPRPVPKEVGIRDLDVQWPGFGLGKITSAPDDLVGLEGALLSPDTEPKPLDSASDFPPRIEVQVNLGAGVPETDTSADPVVGVPLYGRWHALVERISAQPEHVNWVNELNSDPRFRSCAGMGTLVVQKNQEEYMKLAWQQIGEILAANRKIHFLQMALEASQAAFVKHVAPLDEARALALTAPVLARVMGSPVTVRHLVRRSRLTDAALSGALRKQLRPRGPLARRALPDVARRTGLAEMVRQINDGAISAAPPRPAPGGTTLETAVESASPVKNALARRLIAHAEPLAGLLLLLLAALWTARPGVATLVVVVVTAAAGGAAYQHALRLRARIDAVESLAPPRLTPEAVAAIRPNEGFTLAGPGEPPYPSAPGTAGATPAGARPSVASVVDGGDSVAARDFRAALVDLHARLSIRVPPSPPRPALAVASAHGAVLRAIEPVRAFPRRAGRTLRVGEASVVEYGGTYHDAAAAPADRVVPAMAYPDIKTPMYEPLRDLSVELLVPNLGLIPNNTISLMLQNQRFIEAYMVGLNHEFARELLWREYPTDQRGSYFRQFWDVSSHVDREGLSPRDLAEKLRDITRIHEWSAGSRLGDHNNRDPEGRFRARDADGERRPVVLVIRGDLLKRYPNTVVYAQHARWGTRPEDQLRLVLWDETGEKSDAEPQDPNVRFPLFKARVDPDLHFIGFDLTLGEVRGDPALAETAEAKARIAFDRLGWFFVIKEVVGEPRFGLDDHAGNDPSPASIWDNFSWEHLGPDVAVIDVVKPLPPMPTTPNPAKVAWGANAADLACILYQKPVLVAIHGRDMLKKLA